MLKNQKQLNLPALEEKVLKFWKENRVFEKSLALRQAPASARAVAGRQGKKRFVFFEGPPYANGKPGIHHVLARVYKDVILRFRAMRGYSVPRRAGWDTHGLPVEIAAEKALGLKHKKDIETFGVERFNEEAKKAVWIYKDEWERMTERIGYWLDLKDAYVTMSPEYIETLWWVFGQIAKRKLLAKLHKVVPWCPRCETALSSHELAQGYKTITDKSVIVKFPISNFQFPKTFVLSWTTTPWTLPGNVALAVGKDIDYAVLRAKNGEHLIVARDIAKKSPLFAGLTIVKTLKGKDLVGLAYEPLFAIPLLRQGSEGQAAYKVYAADFVATDEGTGIVHTAVMYGEDDYELGKKVGLPMHHTVTEAGTFKNEVKGFAGMAVKAPETEKKLIDYLSREARLFAEEPYTHEYPFCWRCESPVLYYARDSWFIMMSRLRKELLRENKKINWIPEHVKNGRFGEWLREVKDWAISRERYWGSPLPVWEHMATARISRTGRGSTRKLCKEPYLVIGSYADLDKYAYAPKKGQHNWPYDKAGNLDPHRPYIDKIFLKCPHCGGKMQRIPEVADVWFDSGAMPFAQAHYPFISTRVFPPQFQKTYGGRDPTKGGTRSTSHDTRLEYPADYIAEGMDQTRGWFYTLLAIGVLLKRGAPYKNVISLGLIRDKHGQKMSKSKGNVVEPFAIIKKYGADALRWYFYTVNDPGEPKDFDEAEVGKVARRLFLLLYNSYVFYATYADQKGQRLSALSLRSSARRKAMDDWILARLRETSAMMTRELERYHVLEAARALEALVDDLSRWYIRRTRKNVSPKILQSVLAESAKLLAPFAPFFSEAFYQSMHKGSVHLTDWPKAKPLSAKERGLLVQMREIRRLAGLALAEREKAGIRVRQPLATLNCKLQTAKFKINRELLEILKDEVNVKEVIVDPKLKTEVMLDTKITPELKEEGTLREFVRFVQGLRHDAGYKPKDKITLFIEAPEMIRGILARHKKEFASRVNAKTIDFKRTEKFDAELETTLEGEKIWLAVSRL